ncbi:MAG: peptide ABC transporter substrate-binding protein [Verrucomicrobia bacterium]|nr:peptide ABC transporter substrate-binding protein [Verrucomicrobiota bacterium]NDD56794.1 peptide ABC transporter substrate-binding protein [Verrucomicrobiota bacterium]NDD81669.1 peptide ABC transporter substrate-binding protein [Verrucomicrobiota bacterium]
MIFRRVLPGWLGLWGLTFLSGCNSGPRADLVICNGAEPQTLDPALVSGQLEGRICAALYEGLTRRDARGKSIPAAAESWSVSPDGKTYTFTLRPGLKWSNGDPVTAADFRYSWLRALDPVSASPYAEILFFIRGAEDFQAGRASAESVEIAAPDDRTLRVRLKNPVPFFPSLISFTTYLPVHRATVEKYGDRWTRPEHWVGNGPYLLKAWQVNDRVSLQKNPRYHSADRVRLNRIDALAVTRASTAFNLYSSGQADVLLDKGLIPSLILPKLRGRPDFHPAPLFATYFYRFNVTRPPFDNPKVRRAFSLAIDKEAVVEKITRGGEPIALSLTPRGVPGYLPPSGPVQDTLTCKALLREAGYPNGEGFPRISILYNKSELNEQIAVELQAQWKRTLGVQVELRNQEWATYLRSLDTLDFDIARSSWVGDYDDPLTFLDCFATGRGNNRTGWSDPSYDNLLAKAQAEPNAAVRLRFLGQAEEILILQAMPILPLYHFVGCLMFDPKKWDGLLPNLLDEHPFSEIGPKGK